jgi:hypothetical protein
LNGAVVETLGGFEPNGAVSRATPPGAAPGPATRDFASVLRRAIAERGLGLERIKDRLDDRGFSVSVATLSYWRSGRSQPERKRSLAALPHLEDVLGLAPGTLRGSLSAPRERGRRRDVVGLDAVWPDPAVARVLRRLDTRWDAELERISLHDVLTVGPDRTEVSLLVRQVMRARCDGPDRRVIMHCLDDAAAALPVVRSVRGCRVGRTASDVAAGVVGVELLFLQPLRRGQTVLIEYALTSCPPRPLETQFTRRLRLPTREYLLQVRFSPEALPATCERFGDDEHDVRRLELDPAHSVHLVDIDCPAGTKGVRWTWPEVPERQVKC